MQRWGRVTMVKVVIQEWERQVTNPGVASPEWRKVECQEDEETAD